MATLTVWKEPDKYNCVLQLGKLQSAGQVEEHDDMKKEVKPIRDY